MRSVILRLPDRRGLRRAVACISLSAGVLAGCQQAAPTGLLADRPAVIETSRLGDPLPNMTPQQQGLFSQGSLLFSRVYTPATGLGPLYNGASCVECHSSPIPGGGSTTTGVRATAFLGGVCNDLADQGGPVVQLYATPALHDTLGISSRPVPPQATAVAFRTTPAVWGSGLLDAVPDTEILRFADPGDRDGDGVLGHANRTATGQLGRFGRKAQVATLWDFVGQAYLFEMGITNSLYPAEQTVDGHPLPPGVDPVGDTEITNEDLNSTDAFVRWLAAPRPVGSLRLQMQGRQIFAETGCAACHAPELRTAGDSRHVVGSQTIAPYTDLLLHDMGSELADICLGQALPADFRTEPLWGLRFRTEFLHDGRAKTLDAAIQLHAGEASGSRQRYRALSAMERGVLLSFLAQL